MKVKNIEPNLNQILTPLAAFLESYNKGIPADFPHVSAKMLREFQVQHPSLFKNGDEWSIDKHRKKLMDWLSSYRETRVVPAIS